MAAGKAALGFLTLGQEEWLAVAFSGVPLVPVWRVGLI